MTDNDPFADSDPNPANTMPEPDANFETVEDGVVASDDVSCEGCVHADVCVFRERFASMLEQRTNPPLFPNDLAVICDAFEPK